MRTHEHQGHLGGVAIVGHTAVVVVNRLEADLILQAEHEDDRVDPQGKLGREEKTGQTGRQPVKSSILVRLPSSRRG